MEFYINGNKVGQEYAFARYLNFAERVNGMERAEVDATWYQCLESEEARDEWLPDNLEIVV